MRSSSAACAILVLLMGTVDAEQCPPGALGVSRTLVVDPNEHPRVGSMQYPDIGDPQGVSPFFRIPGLLRQKSVEQYLAAHGDMTWSADFVADDWTRIKDSEVARRAISRIEARGKGILLLHDIHQRTVLALPEILNELKSRGYKIVHVVPAAADRPKTATSAQQWVARPTPEQHTSPSQMRPLRQGISRRHGQEPESR